MKKIKNCLECKGQIELAGQTQNKEKVYRCTCCGTCYL